MIDSEETIQKYQNVQRSEEVQDIIDRMPTKFGLWVSVVALFVIALLLLFGFVVSYPDVIQGRAVLNANVSPVKLVCNTSGKLQLLGIVSSDSVSEGETIAYIKNSTSYDTLIRIEHILKTHRFSIEDYDELMVSLPPKAPLGELSSLYNNFLSNLYHLHNFYINKKYEKQIAGLSSLRNQQQKYIENNKFKAENSSQSIETIRSFLKRDSILFTKGVIAKVELEKSELDYLNIKNSHANIISGLIEAQKQEQQTINRIDELKIMKATEEKELKLAASSSLNILKDNIKAWKDKYLFYAPFAGKVQFLKFWTSGQFVQTSEEVFTVIPPKQVTHGQITIGTSGSGKVKKGQTVIIKLDDFPYLEYGSIKGAVHNISLSTSTERTNQGNIDTYLVTVQFDDGIMTNYGSKIEVVQETKGQAEIIVNERKLITRFFDNLKYVLKK